MKQIFTIGHSTHPPEVFVSLLDRHGIRLLADIRRFPASRRQPWFARQPLERLVLDAGIAYQWFEALGGHRRALPASPKVARSSAFRGYADHTATDVFRRAAAELENLARAEPAAYMCAEALWWQCHRMVLSDFLALSVWTVTQIMANGSARPHRPTPEAVWRGGNLLYASLLT